MNGHDDNELSEDIRKLIETVTQGNTSGAWNNDVAEMQNPNGLDHHMQVPLDPIMEYSNTSTRAQSHLQSQSQSTQAVEPPPLPSQPAFIIFGASEDDLSFIIPKKSLANLPEIVMRHLATKGNLVGPSIYMTNYDQLESMKRLKEYLDNKNYSPFNPRVPLDLLLVDGVKKSWKLEGDNLGIVKVTQETSSLFDREIDLYLFAKEVEYDDLRQTSLKNIMYGYPKSLEGVWQLVQRLFTDSHPADRVLRQHIVSLIDANRGELTSHRPYVSFMKRFLTIHGTFGKVLLDAYIKAAEDSKRLVGSMSLTDKKPPTRVVSESSVPKGPAALTNGPPRKAIETVTSKSDAGWPVDQLRPSDLPKLSQAILAGRLVIARRSGYGTIVVPGNSRGRNKGFQFSAGEILLTNTLEATTSARNIIVYNSFGEKGDVLSDILFPVPAELGIGARDRGKSLCCSLSVMRMLYSNCVKLRSTAYDGVRGFVNSAGPDLYCNDNLILEGCHG